MFSSGKKNGPFERERDVPETIRTNWYISVEKVKELVAAYLTENGEVIPPGTSFIQMPEPSCDSDDTRKVRFGVDSKASLFIEKKPLT